jgi:hypothetical protein
MLRAGERQEVIIDPDTGLVIGERRMSGATLFGWGPKQEMSLTACASPHFFVMPWSAIAAIADSPDFCRSTDRAMQPTWRTAMPAAIAASFYYAQMLTRIERLHHIGNDSGRQGSMRTASAAAMRPRGASRPAARRFAVSRSSNSLPVGSCTIGQHRRSSK